MEQQDDKKYTEDDAMKVLLTPQAYEEYKRGKLKKQQELSDEEKLEIDKQMADPLHNVDSEIVNWLKDLWIHPEKCQWYRDHVLFPSTDEKYFPDGVDSNPNEWKVEIPILSMDF